MWLTGFGALLVILGVVFTAAQALWRGRLSDTRRSGPGPAGATLEPRGRRINEAFGWKTNWPGLVLIGLGGVLLLAGAAT